MAISSRESVDLVVDGTAHVTWSDRLLKGFGVLIKVDRAEDLDGQPLPVA